MSHVVFFFWFLEKSHVFFSFTFYFQYSALRQTFSCQYEFLIKFFFFFLIIIFLFNFICNLQFL